MASFGWYERFWLEEGATLGNLHPIPFVLSLSKDDNRSQSLAIRACFFALLHPLICRSAERAS
jgi:hypothetical protein